MDDSHAKKHSSFRFDRSLKNNEEIKALVASEWRKAHGLPVIRKISYCRKAIIRWSKDQQRNNLVKLKEKQDALELALSNAVPNQAHIDELKNSLLAIYKDEEEFWRQRSRVLWLRSGDKNSAYFHAITRGRRVANRFSVIEDNLGRVVYKEEQITNVIQSYFQELFTGQGARALDTIDDAIQPLISEEMNASLIAPPSAKEIKTALFSIHGDKAPGPDGFSACFFQANWATMKDDIVAEIQTFFESGQMPYQINETHVRLIPKIQAPRKVSDYRPIALCSVYYKIIAKLLAARMQPILPEIISENQSAFVKGRAISDNVMITHEVLHYLRISGATKRCSMAVKTDMSKAYDRLEWDFIRWVLDRFGFHPRWIEWIMQCITTISYSFLINGSAQGLVVPTRGIRQGDPLSPYIFIMCSEVLSGLCLKAQEDGSLPGLRVSRGGPRINHLLFADDTMFFCRSDVRSCLALKQILNKYEIVSGQQINCQKSALTFSSKTPPTLKASVKQILNISQEGGNGKYLGLPELFGRRKRDLFTSIVDRIRQRGISWSNNFLSTAGKATLLKSVLASIPLYTMSCFKLPLSLCKRIQSALVRFWWDAKPGQRKMCWMSWEKLTIPTKDGGLGFRDIEACNDALLAKLSWRIFTNPNSLLAKMLMAKYCKHSSFLQCQATSSISHGWRSILIGRDLFKQGLGKNIGDGKETLIWDDQWLSSTRPLQAMGPAPLDSVSHTVDTLITPDSNQWDISKVKQVLPHHVDDVLQIIPGKLGGPDRDCWLFSASGCYTSKSGYHVARGLKAHASFPTNLQNFPWKAQVWSLPISQKLKFFLWKALHDILPTNLALSGRSIPIEPACRRCGEPESVSHILFRCPLAQEVWTLAPITPAVTITSDMTLVDIFPILKKCVALPPTGISMEPLYPWILWYLWLSRNDLIFTSTNSYASSVIEKASRAAKEWQAAQESPNPITPAPIQTSPNFSTQHVCYVDAAWRAESKTAGFGWEILTNSHVSLRQNSATRRHTPSVLAAEALALLSALQDLLSSGWLSVKMYSDSQQLIKLLSSSEWRSDIYGVLQDIRIISSAFHELSFSFVSRNNNSIADGLAKGALYSLAETL